MQTNPNHLHQLYSIWLSIPKDSDFSIFNLPFGIFKPNESASPRAGIAIGDHIVDLVAAAEAGLFGKRRFFKKIFEQGTLNDFIALGKPVTNRIRRKVRAWLEMDQKPENAVSLLCDRKKAIMLMPIRVPNYTDFYSSIEHATNVGKMFRPDNPLMPNWRWLPVGYHGRASSVVVSGTDIKRPSGQILPPGGNPNEPVFSPSRQMDFELEMAFVIGKENPLGTPIPVDKADEYIFGLVLFNDWSARDIQRWEYVPLGPFLGKNFGSSVSPWIVPLEALKPFKVKGPKQKPAPLEYLKGRGAQNYEIALEVSIDTGKGSENLISRSNTKYLYWSMAQQLAHHTVNGCNVQVGDLLASGTISGPTEDSLGSLLEISQGGKKPMKMNDGTTRTFLENGDKVILRGWAENGSERVGFGEVSGKLIE